MGKERQAGVRRAEIVGALSLATDLGLGQPMEHALRAAFLAARIAEIEGLAPAENRQAYYVSMLMFLGCSSAARPTQAVFGDEIEARGWLTFAFLGRPQDMAEAVAANTGDARDAVFAALPSLYGTGAEQCEVGQMLARTLGLGADVVDGLGQVFERWDGMGVPHGLREDAVAPAVRVAQIARNVELFWRKGGVDAVVATLRQRAGSMHDPAMVDRVCASAARVVDGLEAVGWSDALGAEPGPHDTATGADLEAALHAMGDFVDLKTPFFRGHSRAVARLAVEAARGCQLPESDVATLGRAAIIHDVGRASVSVKIWDKPGPLSDAEWERVRMHAYYTERIVGRVQGLGDATAIAARHHERQDGSGYHRASAGAQNPPAARILAAADVYRALREERPHRAGLGGERAAAILEEEARAGRLDRDAVRAVLSAAGHRARPPARGPAWPRGLTNREIEVLRLVTRGMTNAVMADVLGVSPSTVDHHLRHIYDKLGVSTRAAAALFAAQNDLLDEE